MDDAKTLMRFKLQVLKMKDNSGIPDVLDLLNHQIQRAKQKKLSLDNIYENRNIKHWDEMEPFYDCNTPPKIDEDKYEKIPNITRVEIIGKNGREFSKWLENSYYEISMQDDNKTIKLFELN